MVYKPSLRAILFVTIGLAGLVPVVVLWALDLQHLDEITHELAVAEAATSAAKPREFPAHSRRPIRAARPPRSARALPRAPRAPPHQHVTPCVRSARSDAAHIDNQRGAHANAASTDLRHGESTLTSRPRVQP
jgi:hypothetical protein